MPNNSFQNKKIAMVIAFKDFRDEECFIPRSVFLAEGFDVKIASSRKGQALGVYGGLMQVDITLDDLRVNDFSAIVFVGGAGASQYIENGKCHQIAREAVAQNKILAAICIAPAILAKAGALGNKKAAVWSSEMDKSMVKILKEQGASYSAEPVVRDNNIITANGPQSARKFAETIARALKG